MAKRIYRTVETSTLKGLKTAERLHANGWKQDRVGMFSTRYYKDTQQVTTRSDDDDLHTR